jgi:hypothetical protein
MHYVEVHFKLKYKPLKAVQDVQPVQKIKQKISEANQFVHSTGSFE